MYRTDAYFNMPETKAGYLHMELTPAKIILLHTGQRPNEKVLRLLARFDIQTIHINVVTTDSLIPDQFVDCDLILFEAFDPISNESQAALNWIRMGSRAPLVMLTHGARTERTISGLMAGADAVMSLNMSWDVIIAHCYALVRRWRIGQWVPASALCAGKEHIPHSQIDKKYII
jgi:DNA-binding NarL/FixJ family response regulator